MEATYWIPSGTTSLLDVGCNVGELLSTCGSLFPEARLAGVDINHAAVERARKELPNADIQQGFGFDLPFRDESFQCVTCIEVIEHVPAQHRAQLLSEIRRVLKPAGRLILRCPHDGLFGWLDPQNFRFRFPKLYGKLVGLGGRDAAYEQGGEALVWHQHFTRDQLLGLAGKGWEVEACEFGGLVLFPISDILRWPFYRRKRYDNGFVRLMSRIASFELGVNFGTWSFGILLALKKV
jgi:SAM-dependent methyltransferase